MNPYLTQETEKALKEDRKEKLETTRRLLQFQEKAKCHVYTFIQRGER